MSDSNKFVFFRLHFIVFLFGFTGILGDLISISAIPLVWYRMWIASFIILLFLVFKKRLDFKIGKNFWQVILAGVLIAAHWITFFHAIKISTVSVALVCISTGAFFGSLLGPIFTKSKIQITEILLGLAVVGGIYIIFKFEGDYTMGIITALISAFLSALFSIMNANLIKSYRPNQLTFYEMMVGFISISIFMYFQGNLNLEALSLNSSDWLYLILLGSICTAYAFIESVALMKHISPFTFLLAINLEPIYAIILALIFLNEAEKLNPYFFIGAAIILSTVFVDAIIKRRNKRKHQKSVTTE